MFPDWLGVSVDASVCRQLMYVLILWRPNVTYAQCDICSVWAICVWVYQWHIAKYLALFRSVYYAKYSIRPLNCTNCNISDSYSQNLSGMFLHYSVLQWSAVTVTRPRIGKSVSITDCHSNSVSLILLNESGIVKTVIVAECHSNRCHSNRRPLYYALHRNALDPNLGEHAPSCPKRIFAPVVTLV